MKKVIFLMTLSFSIFADKRVEIAGNEASKYLTEVQKKYQLKIEGRGGGYSDCMFDIVSFSFCKHGITPSVNEARQYCLEIACGLVKRINKNKNLLVYVKNHEADLNNIHIRVSFFDANGKEPPKDRVAFASLWGKRIYYTYFDGKHFQDLFSENLTNEQIEEYLNKYEKNPL